MTVFRIAVLPVILGLMIALTGDWALALEPGAELAPWTLSDQFEQPKSLSRDTRILLVTKDMTAGKLVNQALADKPKGYLEKRGILYLADIHAMPALVTKLFALPKMRQYNYPIVLDRDGQIGARYPVQEQALSWYQLNKGKLVAERHFTDVEALRQALDEAPY